MKQLDKKLKIWLSATLLMLFATAHAQFPAPYCPINFTSAIEPITLVNFGTINNTSPAALGGTAHEDFTAMSTTVTPTVPYTITLKGNTGGPYTTYLRVFVDWNQDGDLTDPGESYDIGTIVSSTGVDDIELSGIITPPADALAGSTRMRVTKKFSAYVADPCQSTSSGYGQAEDYTLNVTAPPSCLPPTAIASSDVTPSGATISWTAPATTPDEYEYYISATNTAPGTGSTIVSTTSTSIVFDTQDPITTYYFWVRSICDGTESPWSGPLSYTTLCGPMTPPTATENFSSFTGAMPNPACWSEATGNLGASPVTLTGTTSTWSSENYNNSAAHSNGNAAFINLYGTDSEWFISPAIDLGDGTISYQLEFDASVIPWTGSATVTTMGEKFVKVVVSTDGGATWSEDNVLVTFDNDNIPAGGVSTIASLDGYSGIVKIGFYASSSTFTPDLRFYIDNFRVDLTPPCAEPMNLTAGSSTEDSVAVSWTAPANAPSNGYQYYYSEANTAPDAATAPSGVSATSTAVISGLDSDTEYFVWVRSDCDADGFSEWTGPIALTTTCDAPEVLTVNATDVCGEGSSTLTATASAGEIRWYDAAQNGNLLGTGEEFITETITENTSFWVSAATTSGTATVGKATPNATSTGASLNNWGIVFDAAEDITLQSVDVYSTTAGTLNIKITNSAMTELYATGNVAITAGGTTTPNTIPLNFNIPAGTGYRILIKAYSGVNLIRDSSGVAFPYVGSDGVVTATSSEWGGTTTGTYYYFYNISYEASCASPRTEVVVNVNEAVAIEAAASEEEICEGDEVTLSVESVNPDYTYVWMPGNLAGAEHTVSPAETTVYTVTATDETAGCVITQEITITVNPLLTPLEIIADSETVCAGTTVALNISGATLPLTQDYCVPVVVGTPGASGDYLNNFTFADITNNGSGDAVSDYTYYENLTANVIADGTTTYNVSLTAGGTSSTYAQQFRIWIDFNRNGIFEESESVYTSTASTYSPNSSTGTVTIPPTAYNGVTRMRVASRFSGLPGATTSCSTISGSYGEYEDYNVNITGGISQADFAWSPLEGLYLDAAATTPYDGSSVSTVYANILTDMTYTATATSEAGCAISDDIILTVNTVSAPVVTELTQTFCNGSTVSELLTDEDEVVWYQSATSTTALSASDVLASGSYFAANLQDGCESIDRTEVTVQITTVPAPTGDAVQQITADVAEDATIEDIVVEGVANSTIIWYASEADMLAGINSLPAGTQLVNGTTYYAVQMVDGCTSVEFLAVTVDVQLGRESFDMNQFRYYPNPVADMLTLSYSSNITSVAVYNLVGQQIYSKSCNDLQTIIDMSRFPQGAYLVNVTSGNATQTVKVIKH